MSGQEARSAARTQGASIAATPAPPFPGMVKTEHGWARPCAACGSTDAAKPCPKTEDGFHVR